METQPEALLCPTNSGEEGDGTNGRPEAQEGSPTGLVDGGEAGGPSVASGVLLLFMLPRWLLPLPPPFMF